MEGYSTDILNWIVTIYNKKDVDQLKFGEKPKFEPVAVVHADMSWKKGQRSLNVGAMDSHDTVLIRMRWNNIVTRDSLLECEGVMYQIQSMHPDRRANTIQITAIEIVSNQAAICQQPTK